MFPHEVAIEFLNDGHQVGIESRDLDSCLAQPQLTEPSNAVVGIKHADDDSLDPPFDDPLGAGNLRLIARCTWLKSREEGCASQCFRAQLPLEKRELGMLALSQLAAERLAEHHTVADDNSANFGRDLGRLAPRLAGQANRP